MPTPRETILQALLAAPKTAPGAIVLRGAILCSTKIRVSGVEVNIIAERIEYLGPDGILITESYKDFAKKQVVSEYASLDDFVRIWNDADKKQVIIEELGGVIIWGIPKSVIE